MRVGQTARNVQWWKQEMSRHTPGAFAKELSANYRQAERRFAEKNVRGANMPHPAKREGRR